MDGVKIDELGRGRHLNALVAVEVMGKRCGHHHLTNGRFDNIARRECLECGAPAFDQDPQRDYSRSMGDAWPVVEAMRSAGWDFHLTARVERVEAWFYGQGSIMARGQPLDGESSPAAAICRAAVSARRTQSEVIHGF